MIENKIQKKIDNYEKEFYGYGSWKNKFWFVGIEEGGCRTFEELCKRIDSWESFNTSLIDCKKHHDNIGLGKIFTNGILQPTWDRLIQIFHIIKGINLDREERRNTIKNSWGHNNSEVTLLELFPLPVSKNIETLSYNNEKGDLIELYNREEYEHKVEENRVNFLKKKLKENQPILVIFYFSKVKYINMISKILEIDVLQSFKRIQVTDVNSIRLHKKSKTLFVQIPQPSGVRRGGSEFWNKTGEIIKKALLESE